MYWKKKKCLWSLCVDRSSLGIVVRKQGKHSFSLLPLTRTESIASKKIKDKVLKICLWARQTAFPFISEGIVCLFPSVQIAVPENSL